MALFFLGEGLMVLGEVLIGISVLLVHRRMMRDHRIDKKVVGDIRKEQLVGVLGITFIIVGYILTFFV